MAKKSDASKKVLKDYESPSGSTEILDPNQPVYLLNQQEMDEELKHFRSFYAQSEPNTTSTPTTKEGASPSLDTTTSQKTIGTSLKLEGTAIDSSLEELEQRADESGSDSSSKPTAVVIVT